ncbi:MAG: aminodeoxychorismate/anthranilate synthase component II [Bacteroidota bacterium]
MKKVLVIDNYDSFTYNLVYLLRQFENVQVDVVRNDFVKMETLKDYDKLLFSPGPGVPQEAGMMCDIIREYAGKKPMLGVCLGHQAIGEVFGSKLKNLSSVFHGIATDIFVRNNDGIFKDVPKTFKAGRYHSWVIDENNLSDELEVTATDENNLIMSVAHKKYDIQGVQFHPESILTEHSVTMMSNWINK